MLDNLLGLKVTFKKGWHANVFLVFRNANHGKLLQRKLSDVGQL
jgi:hypothetical protein